MTKPIVAIVGRTNVGKSTLLNRLAGRRMAVVADLPGTTRDRVIASILWQEQELTVVDTGGWQVNPLSSLEQKVMEQVGAAIAEANAIIFLTDVKDGVIAADEEMAEMLRGAGKPIVLAVNKVDSAKQANIADFYRLGIGTPVAISAYHNLGIDDLMNDVLASLPPVPPDFVELEQAKLAIVGRPNVGKSTLLNALLGSERAIVHEAPGTTRDTLDAMVHWGDKKLLLIDTAGVKRRGRRASGVDYYSLIRALQTINRCDVALLLINASEFVTTQDMHIFNYVMEAGKGLVLVVNKWDLIPSVQRKEFKLQLERRLKFIPYVPIVYISAELGQNINKVLPQGWRVWREKQKRLSQSAIDAVITQAVSMHPPPRIGTKQLRVIRARQDESRPATFIFRVNDPQIPRSYQKYLENKLHHNFGFCGVPLHLIFTKGSGKSNKGEKAVKV